MNLPTDAPILSGGIHYSLKSAINWRIKILAFSMICLHIASSVDMSSREYGHNI